MAKMDTFIVGRHLGKIIQFVLKINASTKSLVERLCDFKIYAITVLSFIGSYVHSIRQPSRPRTMLFSVQQQARTTLYRLPFSELAPYVVFGPDQVGIHSISLAARYRVAACSTTLTQGFEKIHNARGHNCTPIFALSPIWEKEFLVSLHGL